MARALTLLTFLALAAENFSEAPFAGLWSTPVSFIGDLLFRATPIKAPAIALLLFAILAAARGSQGARSDRAAPLDRWLWINLATHAALLAWGLLRGGSLLSAMLQIQVMILLPVAAFTFLAVLRTEEDFRTLGKVIVMAGLYRATLAIYFRFAIVPTLDIVPLTMTTHADTILFVTTLSILLSWALEERTFDVIWRAALFGAYVLFAVQINNRRLAWVELVAAMLVIYVLLPSDDFKRWVNKSILRLAPVVALYLALGWGSENPFFAPAKSFSTMFGKKQDASSQTRDIENYNLLVTLRDQKLVGSGWGHMYNEVSVAYSVADVFAIYRYVPHNSLLGIWAFAGYVGSTGLWGMFVVAAFLGSRAYVCAETPLGRTICACSVVEIVIYSIQAYGDMGIVSWNGNFTMGLAFAATSRMAVATGAFPSHTDTG